MTEEVKEPDLDVSDNSDVSENSDADIYDEEDGNLSCDSADDDTEVHTQTSHTGDDQSQNQTGVTAETGENFWGILLLVGLVYVIVQLIQDLIIVPKIMGHIMGMSPALILLSLSVWGYVFGFIGLIIALPLTTLALSYYKRYIIKD